MFVTVLCLIFTYVYLDQFKFCVVCVDGLGYVYVVWFL